jgi:signal peptide peptidase SppA
MSKFAHVAGRLFNTPLALRPEKAEMLCAALVDRMGIAKLDTIDGTSLAASQLRQKAGDWMDEEEAIPAARRQYSVEQRVARIPINGTLVHKLGGVSPWSGMVGYDCLEKVIADALANKEVGAILLDIDSPGGEVAGCFDFARKLRGMSRAGGGRKPIVAFANEMACSAAYAIACSCDAVMTTETGIVGSIGVWTMQVDMTKGLSKNGIEVTMIRAGERKARGGPYEVADEATFSKLQSWVDETWGIFCAHVGECRGEAADDVRALEGDWFTGREALEMNLVDAVDNPDAIFEAVAEMAR